MINVPNLKYKTTLCHNWQEGTPCQKGPNCYFAHGEHQLRKIQENQQIIASRNNYYLQYQQTSNYKTVYCKFYAKGQCKLDASCTFAHQKKQKRRINKPVFNQQPPIIPYMQYTVPIMYSYYPYYDSSNYYVANIESSEKVQYSVESTSPTFKSSQNEEIQSKSEQKKRSRIEQKSTNEKQKEEVQNEEDLPKSEPQNKCFNFQ